MSGKKIRLSKISAMHYFKLVFRSLLFLAALALYIYSRVTHSGQIFGGAEDNSLVLIAIWTVYMIEIVLRFFPSPTESMGCQKQFGRNFRATDEKKPRLMPARSTVIVTLVWLGLNGIFGVLYLLGAFDAGIMLLISLLYAVCDMICILFFCPFQTWFMKNKCCNTCRIYNWDYAMMFTPLIFVRSPFAITLVLASLALLLRWEITYRLYPERFAENTNCSLTCASCEEKLCHHKKQLRGFLKKNMDILKLKGNTVIESVKKITEKNK